MQVCLLQTRTADAADGGGGAGSDLPSSLLLRRPAAPRPGRPAAGAGGAGAGAGAGGADGVRRHLLDVLARLQSPWTHPEVARWVVRKPLFAPSPPARHLPTPAPPARRLPTHTPATHTRPSRPPSPHTHTLAPAPRWRGSDTCMRWPRPSTCRSWPARWRQDIPPPVSSLLLAHYLVPYLAPYAAAGWQGGGMIHDVISRP